MRAEIDARNERVRLEQTSRARFAEEYARELDQLVRDEETLVASVTDEVVRADRLFTPLNRGDAARRQLSSERDELLATIARRASALEDRAIVASTQYEIAVRETDSAELDAECHLRHVLIGESRDATNIAVLAKTQDSLEQLLTDSTGFTARDFADDQDRRQDAMRELRNSVVQHYDALLARVLG